MNYKIEGNTIIIEVPVWVGVGKFLSGKITEVKALIEARYKHFRSSPAPMKPEQREFFNKILKVLSK